ncbi:MAG: RNA methyltransferase [Rhodospirillaceae bacterium]|nr:RNA methyltransferase [Rhodospirillaceae bacterium]
MLWGTHAVRAALANPARRVAAGWATPSAQGELGDSRFRKPDFAWSTVTAAQLAARLPDGAVHQGVAVAVEPLRRVPLDAILASEAPAGPIVVLDRVTDPHNVGAILRSCVVFGAAALITADRHAPPESGALAKAAAGALDLVPWVRVANLARALAVIRDAGWWVAGLDGSAEATLAGTGLADGNSRTALVLGAEGQGLRRLTKENCNILVRIPMQYANYANCVNLIDSLNVSNAAAVALYELCRN